MSKYFEVSRIYMKTQLAWRADVLFHMIFTIVKMLFAYLLWGLIFREKAMVGEFTFHGILSYYIVSAFLSEIEMSDGVSNEIHDRMRNGTFTKYIILPVNIEWYFVFMEAGIIGFYGVFNFIAAVIWKNLFRVQFVFAENAVAICAAVVMIVLGLLFMTQLNILLGILTLKYQGIGTFLMIKNNLAELVTGSIVPLVLFPEPVVNIMRLLPFYYVTYLPSMLLTGHCEEEAWYGVFVLGVWCIVIQIFIVFVWKKYIRSYEGVGV